MVDSPEADVPLDVEDTSLLPRTSSYYEEFHNAERQREHERDNQSSPVSNLSNVDDAESPSPAHLDTQFSITAQLGRTPQREVEQLADEESLDEADRKRGLDQDADDEDEDDRLAAKKAKLDNNNTQLSPRKLGNHDDYANGYLSQREMLAQYMNSYGLKGVTKPLVIST